MVTSPEVDACLASAPEPQRSTLTTLRATLAALLPEAEEGISYGLPAFKVNGKGVAGYGYYAGHCTYVPMSGSVTAELAAELADYTTTKGAVSFAVDEPLPADLVKRLVDARLAEIDRSKRR